MDSTCNSVTTNRNQNLSYESIVSNHAFDQLINVDVSLMTLYQVQILSTLYSHLNQEGLNEPIWKETLDRVIVLI
jgi:hypothetical protein